MQRVAYIRFAAYGLIIVAFLWPQPKARVIPVDTVPGDPDIAELVDSAIRVRQEEQDVARVPGFETTRMSGREVMSVALEHARKRGADLAHFRPPQISLMRKGDRMQWLVSWDLKGLPVPGGFFSILIDDASGTVTLTPGT